MKAVRLMIATAALSLIGLSSVQAGAVFSSSELKAHASLNLIQRVIVETGNREGSLQRIVQALGERFRNEGVLDQTDVAELDALDLASDRAQKIARYLAYDINGDGVVTRGEVEAALARRSSRLTDKGALRIINELFVLDENTDDTVDFQEMLKVIPSLQGQRRASGIASVLALDPNRDGRLTKAELVDVFLVIWESIDKNADGRLSNDERAAVEAH